MKLRSLIFFFLILFVIALLSAYYLFNYYTKEFAYNSEIKLVEINKGESVTKISKKLLDNKIIFNDKLFVLYVRINKLEGSLKAGEYEFSKNLTIKDVTERLINGDVKLRKVTIPEGLTLKQIAQVFERNNLFSATEFLSALEDQNLKQELLGSEINSYEGFIFPETYNYSKDAGPEEFVRMMVAMHKKVFDELRPNYNEENDLSDYEILKLASIIEKESGANSELRTISSVFHNRLRIGMKLDSDPTIIYGMGDSYDGNIRKRDIEQYTAYNTYHIQGLPPTPISNPGKAAIEAAMNPEQTEFLFFVSMGNGTHYFSKNYKEHRRAVYNYQIKKRN
ncbi:MAG: endolytic transglycosylase MltG [Candidatus Dadabacteria bacterium]|nr:endolytic transglycosylase MltG [Candidatus Dadabacteria bacterium]NIS08191.1 endolytic transglycosylase MltG [Candidatus Dadabacteria bacterium]NIY21341.1 endolytic transglycosylase MltG [Candidatus Dadabacteria bacterium]